MMRDFYIRIAAVCLLALGAPVMGQAQDAEGVYIIYDSSNSMWAALPDQSRKYEAARIAMRELAGQDFAGRDVALRMYGHRRKDDCSDSELVVPFSAPDAVSDLMINAMEAVRPTGRTPIDLSLRQALADFGDRKGSIILISDGVESCDADPCALMQEWRARDVQITVHVVGLGLKGKERAAMECIAEAAGTPYRDAFSTSELAESLTEVVQASEQHDNDGSDAELASNSGDTPEAGEPAPQPDEVGPEFKLVVMTEDGARQRGAGVLTAADGTEYEVETFQRHTPPPGDFTLTAGIRLVGGEIYKPTSQSVTVAENGRTTAVIQSERPPEVSATFAMEGEELRAVVVTAYRDGKKLGSFKGDETAFVPEGEIEFRAKLPGTSGDISVTETLAAGDSKVIAFDADIEVHLTVRAIGTANGVQLKGRPSTELWQDGKRVDKINNTSGGLVAPGVYTLHIDDNINVFETEITVTREKKQEIVVDVPAGGLTVVYQDAAGNELKPERVFVTPEGVKRGKVRSSNQPHVLLPGRYTLTGWPKDAGFPDTVVEMKAGEDQTVILRATK